MGTKDGSYGQWNGNGNNFSIKSERGPIKLESSCSSSKWPVSDIIYYFLLHLEKPGIIAIILAGGDRISYLFWTN